MTDTFTIATLITLGGCFRSEKQVIKLILELSQFYEPNCRNLKLDYCIRQESVPLTNVENHLLKELGFLGIVVPELGADLIERRDVKVECLIWGAMS